MEIYCERIGNVINRKYSLIFNNNNIVGIGRGFKRIKGQISNIPSLMIFVKEKLPKDMLSCSNIIPSYINGCVTDVLECTECRDTTNSTNYEMLSNFDYARPAYGGLSVGVSTFDFQSDGTIGCAVVSTVDENSLFFLTSANVLGRYGVQSKNIDVYQPSIRGGASGVDSKYKIGRVDKVINQVPFKVSEFYNEVNAGLVYCGLKENKQIKRGISGREYLKEIVDGSAIKLVEKGIYISCRGDNVKRGVIIADTLRWITEAEDRNSTRIAYKNQILCEIDCETNDYGTIGYIKEENLNYGVGLLWGKTMMGNVVGKKSNQVKCGIFSPLKKVVDLLEVKLL